MRVLALLGVLVVAACGADGPPEPQAKQGVSISGEARIGVTGSL